ncbi:eosinophil granule major basic protein 2-like [Cyclopterus lumpus]|uniref:eosinophil granule major basic protein 2-like n=1 Tax=Cyclopterus lumpus TaxID=8103 RepID=UPI0014861573|nr:eosinophil granule major basic protein 2-like [Cyclopterus lumpus]
MELEPEEEQSFVHQQVMPDGAIMEEGPALDIIGQQMPSSSEYFPDEEAMHMEHGQLQEYLLTKGAGSELIGEEEQSSKGLPEVEDGPDGAAQIGVAPKREKRAFVRQGVQHPEETRSSPSQDKQGRSHCPGVILEGKCYQFFKEPKAAADAEFFCQEHFAGGHLASITSQHIHREVMDMMLRHNGALTRSWIGGLRYLKTGRFIWLDGSHWSYADWLSGEPNNTADVEDCVGVLARGDGKFNGFACWQHQAFVCSYTLTAE